MGYVYLRFIKANTNSKLDGLLLVQIMNTQEKDTDVIVEELDPDWVNHWHEKDNKKEPNTKQITF
jgi:hypothetical protein